MHHHLRLHHLTALAFTLLLPCVLALPLVLHAQTWRDPVNIPQYINADNLTLTAGQDFPYLEGDLWKLSGEFTTGTINLAAGPINLAAVYVAGDQSLSFIGSGLAISSTYGNWDPGTPAFPGDIDNPPAPTIPSTTPAANGKLVLGGDITDATTPYTLVPFTGVIDMTGITGTNRFDNGIDINSGTLRISTADQIGPTGLSKLNFLSARDTVTGSFDNLATLEIAPNSNIVFDSAYSSVDVTDTNGNFVTTTATANRLVIGDGVAGAIILDENSTLTFSGNKTGYPGANTVTGTALTVAGAAINFAGANGTLLLQAGADSMFIFRDNVSYGNCTIANVVGAGNLLEINNALFDSNTSTSGNGGMMAVNTGTIILNNVTFSNNVGSANGGIFALTGGGRLEVNNFLAVSNTSSMGGVGFQNSASGTAFFNSGTFLNNVATGQGNNMGGGAYYAPNGAYAVFTDVDFIGNQATAASTRGGAIGFNNPANPVTITIVSTTGASLWAGNGNGSVSSGIAGYFNGANGGVTINVNPGAGSTIDMLDPMYFNISSAVTAASSINENGDGLWKLAGATTGTKNGTNSTYSININSGTLWLYRAGEEIYSAASGSTYTTAAGNITFQGSAAGTPGSFSLASGANLVIGGGNAITYTTITSGGKLSLAQGSTLTFDILDGADTGSGTNSMLRIVGNLSTAANYNLITNNSFNPTISFLLGDSLTTVSGSYNLITTGTTASRLNGTTATNLINANGLTQLRDTSLYSGLNYNDFLLQSGLDSVLFGLTTTGAYDTLWVNFVMLAYDNTVITWNGAQNNLWYSAPNWATNATTNPVNVNYVHGNIANLADITGTLTTINVNVPTGAYIAAMYVSGTTNYTITGNSITTSATYPDIVTPATAATGKLVLGARAADNGATVNNAATYTGTLTLTNTANNFIAGIDINTGALSANALALTPTPTITSSNIGLTTTPPLITINPAGTLILDQATDDPAAFTLAGAGSFLKTNTAALTLTADSTPFNGTTTVSSGALLLASSTDATGAPTHAALGGAITVAPAATFGGAGSAGNLTLANNATLQVGLVSELLNTQPLTLASLAIGNGALLNYADYNDTLTVTGALTQAGSAALTFSRLSTGSYSILNATAGYAGLNLPNLAVEFRGRSLAQGSDYTLTTANGLLWLNITNIPLLANNAINWHGAADTNWLAPSNWTTLGLTRTFVQYDAVNLVDDPAAGVIGTPDAPVIIALADSATVAGMFVSGTSSYAITGAGSIEASSTVGVLAENGTPQATGKLILGQYADPQDDQVHDIAFSGVLDLSAQTGTNNFASGVDLYSGTLRISSEAQLGTTLNNLSFLSTGAGVDTGATLEVAPNATVTLDSGIPSTGTLFTTNTWFTYQTTATLFTDAASNPLDPADLPPDAIFTTDTDGTILVTGSTGDILATGTLLTTDTTSTTLPDLPAGAVITTDTTANLITITATDGSTLATGTTETTATEYPYTAPDTANHNIILAGNAAAIVVDEGATLTIAHTTGASGVNGGAFTVRAGSSLTLDVAAGGTAIFQGNASSGTTNAGAIYGTNATIALHATEPGGILFDSNTTAANGGAIHLTATSLLTIDNATFANNYAGSTGGAISVTQSSTAFLSNVIFTSNTAIANEGGAIYNQTSSYVAITSATFAGNNAQRGGALQLLGGSVYNITDALVTGNNAENSGGGLAVINASGTAFLYDVDFTNNTSGTSGGAIYVSGNSGRFIYNVSAGHTSIMAGNSSQFGQGIFIGANAQTGFDVNVAAGGLFSMQDPLFVDINNTQAHFITKYGDGTWAIGGSGTLAARSATPNNPSVNFTVSAGTLQFYGAGQVSFEGKPVQAGSLLLDYASKTVGTYAFNFQANAGTTLLFGGGNAIQATKITIDVATKIVLDISNAQVADAGYSIFTIAPVKGGTTLPSLNIYNLAQSISLIGLDNFDHYAGDTFNLITFGVGVLNSSTFNFNNPAYNLDTIAQNIAGGVPDGFSLQFSDDYRSIQLVDTSGPISNKVVNWNGMAGDGVILGSNWTDATIGARASFHNGDIINLVDQDPALLADPSAPIAITVNSINGLIPAAICVSGTDSYIITGNPINAETTLTQLAGLAVTGKLVLGATSEPDASAIDTTPYSGTLTLANTSNLFTGGIDIYSGHLVGTTETLATGTLTPIYIGTLGDLTLLQPDDTTFDTRITGNGAFIKTGTGMLTLTATNSAFVGLLNLTAGSLTLATGSPLGGSIYAAPSTIIATAADIGGSVILNDNARLRVGVGAIGGQNVAIGGDLALGDGAVLDYDRLTNQLHVDGAITQTGTVTINIDSFQSGTFNLGNLATLKIEPVLGVTINGIAQYIDARQQAALSTNGADLLLTGAGDISRIMYWTGAANGVWNITANDWDERPAIADTGTQVFGIGDRVVFDDINPAALATATVVPTGVIASDMYVRGATSYTIVGGGVTTEASSVFSGSILNAADTTGKLYKQGTGTLTLANNGNDFTGGIQLDQGTLLITGTTNAENTVTVTSSGFLTFAPSGTNPAILIADQVAFADGVTLDGNGTLQFNNLALSGTVNAAVTTGNVYTLTGSITTPTGITTPDFIKTGTGELLFNFPSTGNATTLLDQGIVRFAGVTVTTAPQVVQTVILNGGQLALSTGTATADPNIDGARDWQGITIIGAMDPNTPATSSIIGANDLVHIAGSGTIYTRFISGVNVAVDPGDGGIVTFSNTANRTGSGMNLRGAIRVDSGTLMVNEIDSLGGIGTNNIPKFVTNGGAIVFAMASATSFNGDLEIRAAVNPVEFDSDVTFKRIMRYTGTDAVTGIVGRPDTAFVKTGAATLTVSGQNTAVGITIAQGRYIAQQTNSVDTSGTINVYAGATFEFAPATLTAGSQYGFYAGQSFKPSSSAQSRANFTGSGTLAITAGTNFLWGPNTDITNIVVTGTATGLAVMSNQDTFSFAPSSTITVDQGFLVVGSRHTKMGDILLKNGASMGFQIDGNTTPPAQYFKDVTLKSLTQTGPMPSTLNFNINLDKGIGDNITVQSPITGAYAIAVYNYFGPGISAPSQYAKAIDLITGPVSPDATFTILNPRIDLGQFKYNVVEQTTSSGVAIRVIGTGAMSNSVAFINSLSAGLSLSYFAELDSVSQRLGDLRLAHADTADRKHGLSAWMRGYADQTNFNTSLTGATFNQRHYGGEGGVDFKVAGGGPTDIFLGAYFGYGQTQRAGASDGDSTSNSAFGGLYFTLAAQNGWYADLTSKYNQFTNNFTANAPYGIESTSARFNHTAVGATLEIGKTINFDQYGWILEPQAQIGFAALSGVSYATDSDIRVNQQSATTTRARAGLRWGRDIEFQKLGTMNIYVKGYYGHQYTSDGHLAILTPNGQTGDYYPSFDGEFVTLGAGLAWQLGKRIQYYFDYETTRAACYIKPWSFNLGARYMW